MKIHFFWMLRRVVRSSRRIKGTSETSGNLASNSGGGGGAPMPILRPVKRRGSPPHFFSLHKSNNRAENIAVFICPSSTQVKLKIKVHPRTGHEGPDGE